MAPGINRLSRSLLVRGNFISSGGVYPRQSPVYHRRSPLYSRPEIYLGRQTVRQVRNAGVEPGAIAAAIPVFTGTIPAVEAAVRPLIDYRNIWKRKYRYHDQSPPPHHSNKSEYRMTYHSLNSRISFLV